MQQSAHQRLSDGIVILLSLIASRKAFDWEKRLTGHVGSRVHGVSRDVGHVHRFGLNTRSCDWTPSDQPFEPVPVRAMGLRQTSARLRVSLASQILSVSSDEAVAK